MTGSDIRQKMMMSYLLNNNLNILTIDLNKKTNKLEFDVETLTEIPFIDTDMLFNTKESIARVKRVVDQTKRNYLLTTIGTIKKMSKAKRHLEF